MEERAGAAAGTGGGSTALRSASALCWIDGLAFGLPAVPVVVFLAREGRPPVFLDLFPVYSGGPFEALGGPVFSTLLIIFAVVCAAEVMAGWLLWKRRWAGGVLGLALVPVGAIFWVGFALPGPVIIAVIRTALLLRGWPRLVRVRRQRHEHHEGPV